MLDLSRWRQTCPEMPVIVHWEHPHPGATLDAFEPSLPGPVLGVWGA